MRRYERGRRRGALLAASVAVASLGQGCAEEEPNPSAHFPADAQRTLDEYLRCVTEKDADTLRRLLCFVDDEDQRLFMAFSSRGGQIHGTLMRSQVFFLGKPLEVKKASDESWLVVLDSARLLELRQVSGRWRVLCPTPGRVRCGRAKLTKAEVYRWLQRAEMERVRNETRAELHQRRARYLAVLDLKRRHRLGGLFLYYSGIPTDDASALARMSVARLRSAVALKLDAPNGLRYRVRPHAEAVPAGKSVPVSFLVQNVTGKPIKLRYKPAVEVIDLSNAITARGAIVPPRGIHWKLEDRSPYRARLVHPFVAAQVRIFPGQTHRMEVDLRDYYELPPAKYSISAHLMESRSEEGDYWYGVARSDTEPFEVRVATSQDG